MLSCCAALPLPVLPKHDDSYPMHILEYKLSRNEWNEESVLLISTRVVFHQVTNQDALKVYGRTLGLLIQLRAIKKI